MRPDDLITKCIESINLASEVNNPNPVIIAKIKAAKYTRKTCYPLGKGSPKAILVSTGREFDIVKFDAVELLAFLIVAEGYEMTVTSEEVTFEKKLTNFTYEGKLKNEM